MDYSQHNYDSSVLLLVVGSMVDTWGRHTFISVYVTSMSYFIKIENIRPFFLYCSVVSWFKMYSYHFHKFCPFNEAKTVIWDQNYCPLSGKARCPFNQGYFILN